MLRVLSLLPHVAALLFAHSRVSSAFVPLSSISTGGANTNIINTVRHIHPTLFAVSGSHRSSSDNNENNGNANGNGNGNVNVNANANNNNKKKNNLSTRQDFFIKTFLATTTTFTTLTPQKSFAKCTDIESCREIGEKKVEQDMIENPTVRLKSGVRYKVLQPGMVNGGSGGNGNGNSNGNGNGNDTELSSVNPNSNIDLIFSVSTLSGGYMYSRGFGFEKIDIGDGKLQSDIGLDSLRVQLGKSDKDVPLGIEDALIGMKKGERRRVELPPNVGFETSQWRPEPTTRRGKTRIVGYRQLLEGNGSTRPPFPAATIWDVEVLKIRK